MGKWNKWKLIHKDGLTFKQYIQENKALIKCGKYERYLDSTDGPFEAVLLESGYPALVYGSGAWYGPFFGVLDAKEWKVVMK